MTKAFERALDELDSIAEQHNLDYAAVSAITRLLHNFKSQLLSKKAKNAL